MIRPSPRSFAMLFLVSCALSCLGAAALAADPAPAKPAAADYGEKPSREVQSALEAAMSSRVGKFLDEKNSDGVPTKRGTFSRRFRQGRQRYLPGDDAQGHGP
jgi:hypothetical protein